MGFERYISPLVRGGAVALAGGTVGGFVAGFLPALAAYAGILGGGISLIVIEMFYK